MKQKGQIFSLDLLISVVLVVIAISIAMQFLELKQLEAKESSEQAELERVGNTAAELLVNSPDIVCDIAERDQPNPTVLSLLSNCITVADPNATPQGQYFPKNWGKGWWDSSGRNVRGLKFSSKQALGIPDNYKCLILIRDAADPSLVYDFTTECTDDIPQEQNNYFSANRNIVFSKSTGGYLTKFGVSVCMTGDPTNCPFVKAIADLKVWKE